MGYFVRESDLTLVAITSDRKVTRLRYFNLTSMKDRILLLLAIRHVAYLIPLMFKQLDKDIQNAPFSKAINRPHENFTVDIQFEEFDVIKIWSGEAAYGIYEVCQDQKLSIHLLKKVESICQIIDEKKIPNIVQRVPRVHPKRGDFKLVFSPRGNHTAIPRTLQSLVKALQDVITFLEAFHKEGI